MAITEYCLGCCKIRWCKHCVKSGGLLVYVLRYQVVALAGAFLPLFCTSRWLYLTQTTWNCKDFSKDHLKLQKPVSCPCPLQCHRALCVKCNYRAIAANYDGKRGVYYYTTNFDFKLLPFNITTPASIHHYLVLLPAALGSQWRFVQCY